MDQAENMRVVKRRASRLEGMTSKPEGNEKYIPAVKEFLRYYANITMDANNKVMELLTLTCHSETEGSCFTNIMTSVHPGRQDSSMMLRNWYGRYMFSSEPDTQFETV